MRGDHIDVREVSERDAVRNRACETDQPIVAVIAADNAPGARVLPLDFGAAAPPAPVGLLLQEAPHGVGVQPAGIVVELVGRVMDHERRAYADRFGAMSDTDAIPYEPPDAGDELATLVGSLERQRRTFAWKCSGLDAAGMRATIGASAITLGGLVKHVSLVEASYFQERLHARDPGSPWNTVDWDQDPNWDWRTGAEDPPELVLALWHDTVARSREALHEALERGGLEQLGRYTWPDGRSPSLRRILIDLIEEYARHVGHADLIRESVDGLVGEDPPR